MVNKCKGTCMVQFAGQAAGQGAGAQNCEGWLAQRVMRLFATMRTQGLQPGVNTYTAVTSACGKGWKAERAVQVFEMSSPA